MLNYQRENLVHVVISGVICNWGLIPHIPLVQNEKMPLKITGSFHSTLKLVLYWDLIFTGTTWQSLSLIYGIFPNKQVQDVAMVTYSVS